jgi:hypothetical protein
VNGNVETTAHDYTARIARVAWFCAFVLPLLLIALLLGVNSAQAAAPEGEPAPLAFEEEFEFELGEEDEGEFAEEECATAQEEFEEGELSKAEADEICKEAREAAKEAAGSSAAGGCPIHSATAHSSIQNDRLKLTIGYTTNTPVTATIQIHGIGTFKRHLGKSGVLRFSKTLSGAPHGRAVVHIKLPGGERAECPSRRLVLFPG